MIEKSYCRLNLEDGIIEFEKSNKKIIIEVYGRDDADYLRKKEIKSKILESNNNIYHYVPWNAYLNEALSVKEIKAGIDTNIVRNRIQIETNIYELIK